MKTYDLSPDGKKYYRQTNNELSPAATCKPTSSVMGLDIAGWPLPMGSYRQPEDNVTAMCRTDLAKSVMREIDPGLDGTPPNEVWGVIVWALRNVFYPKSNPVMGPRWDWDLREALFGITQGMPFIASTWLSKGGHVVAVVGYETDQEATPEKWQDVDLAAVKTIIVDDPYGDRSSGAYDTSKSGYHQRYSSAHWAPLWRSTGIQIRPYRSA